jgi:hypothetical protein
MSQRSIEGGGIRVFEDHRDNLTVDVENTLVQGRAAQLRSEDSQSALLWNVFRCLEKIDTNVWLPRLLTFALGQDAAAKRRLCGILGESSLTDAAFHWWQRYDLPPARHEWLRDAAINCTLDLGHYPERYLREKKQEIQRLVDTDLPLEDSVEMPLCIETADWTLGILAVYKGNLRQNTRFDAHRDQVAQWLDAGSWSAQQKNHRFMTLVVYTDGRTFNGETRNLVRRYQGRKDVLQGRLQHRTDEAMLQEAVDGLGDMRWRDLGALLLDVKDEERLGLIDQTVIDELVKYMARKDIGFNFFRRLK